MEKFGRLGANEGNPFRNPTKVVRARALGGTGTTGHEKKDYPDDILIFLIEINSRRRRQTHAKSAVDDDDDDVVAGNDR